MLLGLRACVRLEGSHQKRAVDRLLAQVDDELLQGHGLVVYANEQVAQPAWRRLGKLLRSWAGAGCATGTYCGRKNSSSS